MIKLIASDMDGTLLNENKQLPIDFFDIIEILHSKNITFVAASGRPYSTLYKNFYPLGDKITYIGDNGALVVHEGKTIYKNVLDKATIKEIILACKTIPNVFPVLCGVKGGYIPQNGDRFIDEINKYYLSTFTFDCIDNISDEIFKIAICDLDNALTNSLPILSERFGEKYKVVASGHIWIDIMNLGVHKGAALQKLQNKLNINLEETMAFGDYYNDIELLGQAKYSYVMENALDDMKNYGNFIAKSNEDEGVTLTIKEYLSNI